MMSSVIEKGQNLLFIDFIIFNGLFYFQQDLQTR